MIEERSEAKWLIRFEVDIPAGDRDSVCALATGSENEVWAGGFELRLAEPVPAAVTARAICQPEATAYATMLPGGARPTLGPTADGAEPVICSPIPEP